MKRDQLKTCLLLAFLPAWVMQVIASVLAKGGNQLGFTAVMAASMFVPLLAAVLAKVPLKGMGWKPALRGRVKYMAAAWLLPGVLSAVGAVLFYLLFPAALDLTGSAIVASVGEAAEAQLAEAGLSPLMLVGVSALAALTYAPIINMVAAVGEEAGWRGYLYRELKARFGTRKGRIMGGIIWGVWHWPVMLLAGYEYGKDYVGAPVLGLAVFCLFTVALGILMDALYEKTECIWIPALAHGAVNAAANIPSLLSAPAFVSYAVLGPAPNGLIAGLPLLVLAAWVLWKDK